MIEAITHNMNSRYSKWVMTNGILLILLYFGFFVGDDLAKWIALALIWVTILLSFLLLKNTVLAVYLIERGPAINDYLIQGLDIVYDAAVLAVLIGFGWYLTAVAYSVHMIMVFNFVRKARKEYKKGDPLLDLE